MKKAASVLGRVFLGFILFLTLVPFYLLLSNSFKWSEEIVRETLYAACRMAFYKLCEIRGAGHPSHGKYAAGNDLRYCYRPDCGNAGSLYLL